MPTGNYPYDTLVQARPDLQLVVQDLDLTSQRNKFIGKFIFPDYAVQTITGKYPFVRSSDFLTKLATRRDKYGTYPRYQVNFSGDSYTCHQEGFEVQTDMSEKAQYATWLDLEKQAAQLAMFSAAFGIEQTAAEMCADNSNFIDEHRVGAAVEWTNYATADPQGDVMKMFERIGKAVGEDPDTLIITKTMFKHLIQCDQIKEAFEGQGAGEPAIPKYMTAEKVASILDCGTLIIASGRKQEKTVSGGTETVSYPRLWSDTEAIAMIRGGISSAFDRPRWGARLTWDGDPGITELLDGSEAYSKAKIYSYFDPETESRFIRVKYWHEMCLVNKSAAGKITGIST